MANQSPYDNRDIVEEYLYHKLLKRGYVWEFRAGAEEDDGLREPPAEVVDRRPRALLPLHRVLREAGDEIERTYQRDFAAMSDQLHLTPSTAQRRFTAVIEELFRDGVNWGRIVVFFEFGSTLCVESVNQDMASQVDNIASWMADYLNGPLQNWIRDNGGWDAFVELYSHQRASIFHPWPYLKTVFGLAALGAAGVTIGALFSQK
ncbi:Apoptosis regulator Bcl-2 [Bagarius yarrelli]|uniref:Apoptosis regulator Bcl-2 n=1 Tax=Bagarius yarrelli TaxID=175774 RepID=A0A556TXH3_BAGYA|nr:Apoptosis regulator Bcl-2 [Bagarius yarrelli]